MLKRWIALILALLLVPAVGLADAWEGVTVSDRTTVIEAQASGTLEQLELHVGQTVAQGETLGSVKLNRVFATQDGVVARVQGKAGEKVTGTVLEIDPISPYLVYCSTDKASSKVKDPLIHAGEKLYLRCTKNGTHRGAGIVHSLDGNEFLLEMIAGEMYVGETVYIYRGSKCESNDRVGVGTVVPSDTEVFSTNGVIAQVRVKAGDMVERGQLLYTWIDGDSQMVTSPADGIITAVTTPQGGAVKKDAAVAEMTAFGDVCLEIRVTDQERVNLRHGQTVYYTRGVDMSETPCTGRVTYVSAMSEEELYTVRITPDVPETILGMSVEVRTEY